MRCGWTLRHCCRGRRARIVANLPYNVATPLLVGWLRGAAALEGMTLMFQQEVAERISAAPDTGAYGRLSVLAQWHCRCDLLLRLPPGAFRPPPKVWSAVVGLPPTRRTRRAALFAAMERLTAAAFGQRRKMLRGARLATESGWRPAPWRPTAPRRPGSAAPAEGVGAGRHGGDHHRDSGFQRRQCHGQRRQPDQQRQHRQLQHGGGRPAPARRCGH